MHTENVSVSVHHFPFHHKAPLGYSDISETALEAGFRLPTFLSPGAQKVLAWDDEKDCARKRCFDESLDGRIWSLLWMAALSAQSHPEAQSVEFSARILSRLGSVQIPEVEFFRLACVTTPTDETILTISLLWED